MKKIVVIFILVLMNVSASSQDKNVKLNIPGMSRENTITKEELLKVNKIQVEQSDVVIENFTMTTVDSLGYIHDIKLEKNKFTKEVKNWIRENIKSGHKMNVENVKAKRDGEEISFPHITIDIVE